MMYIECGTKVIDYRAPPVGVPVIGGLRRDPGAFSFAPARPNWDKSDFCLALHCCALALWPPGQYLSISAPFSTVSQPTHHSSTHSSWSQSTFPTISLAPAQHTIPIDPAQTLPRIPLQPCHQRHSPTDCMGHPRLAVTPHTMLNDMRPKATEPTKNRRRPDVMTWRHT